MNDHMIDACLRNLCDQLQRRHGFGRRRDLHAAVLAEVSAGPGVVEEHVDEAVTEYCENENLASHPEPTFTE